MYDPPYTIDQSLYSPGAAIPGPSPGPLSPPLPQSTVQDTSTGKPLASDNQQSGSSPSPFDGTLANEELFDMAQALLAAEAGHKSAVVKEELKHLIKKKRRASGYREEVANNKRTVEESEQLSAQDEERRKRRRDSNRRAATKCREKKKLQDEAMKQGMDMLEKENEHLKQQVTDLQSQLSSLKAEVLKHKEVCSWPVLEGGDQQSETPEQNTDLFFSSQDSPPPYILISPEQTVPELPTLNTQDLQEILKYT